MPRPKKLVNPKYTTLPEERPECFTPTEWQNYWEAFDNEFGSVKRDYPDLYAQMCDDCTLSHQVRQIMKGTCLPRYPDHTPAARRLNDKDADLAPVPALQATTV